MKKLFYLINAPLILLFARPAFALSGGPGAPINPCGKAGGGLDGFQPLCNSNFAQNPAALIAFVVQLLLAAAVVIALIFLIIGGLRWITSGGDKTKLEGARGTVIAAIVGLVIALAAFFIINLVLTVLGLGSLSNFHLPILGH